MIHFNIASATQKPPRMFLLVSTVVFLLQIPFLVQGEGYVVGTLTNDDTYYYLQTAWNMAQTGMCSFDGLSATNGVQMLWFWILAGMAKLASDKSILLTCCLLLTFAFNALSAGLIYLIFRSDKSRRTPSAIMILLWCSLLIKGTYWLGLENSLHAMIGWTVVWGALQWGKPGDNPARILWGLLVLLILNTYIRLDSAVISAMVFAWFGWQAVKRGIGRQLGWMCGASILAAIGLFGGYYLMGGTWIPISGLVKQHWGQAWSHPNLPSMIVSSFPELLPYSLSGSFFTWTALATVAALFLIVLSVQSRNHGIPPRSRICLLLMVANLAYLGVYYFGHISYDLYYRWYKSWQHIMWLLIIGEIAAFILSQKAFPRVKAFCSAGAYAILAFLAILTFRQGYHKFHYPYREYTWHQRYLAAQWINSNTPASILIGSWNAGQLGYFSGRHVVNLDGLINDRYYYEEVVKGGMPLSQYLTQRGVTHLFDYPSGSSFHDLDLLSLPIEREFPRMEFGVRGESFFLWRWPPGSRSLHH